MPGNKHFCRATFSISESTPSSRSQVEEPYKNDPSDLAELGTTGPRNNKLLTSTTATYKITFL